MSKIDQIGLVIWGCKGGYRMFCDNGVVDVNSPEIRATVKDIRSSIAVRESGIDYYALEFTPKYKVYTNYRSSNDSGNGAFIAFTLYVPHSLKMTGIREMLNAMISRYFDEYMDPITRSPLPGKYDDARRWQDMLLRYADNVSDDRRHANTHHSSRQDDKPKIFPYSTIEQVDEAFAKPYSPDFFDCQEVTFMAKDIVDNPEKYYVTFRNDTEKIVPENVRPEEVAPVLTAFPQGVGYELVEFSVNGREHTAADIAAGDVELLPDDRVELRIHKDEYHKDFIFSDIVANARGVIELRGNKYEFSRHYQCDEITRAVPVYNKGNAEMTDLMGRLFLVDGREKMPLTLLQGTQYGFELRGKAVNGMYSIGLLFSDTPKASAQIENLMIVRDAEPIGEQLTVNIRKEVLRLTAGDRKEPKDVIVKITYRNKSLRYTTMFTDRLPIILPDNADKSELQIMAHGYTVTANGDSYKFDVKAEKPANDTMDKPHVTNKGGGGNAGGGNVLHTYESQEKSKRKFPIMWIIIAAVAAIALAVGLYFVFSGSDDEEGTAHHGNFVIAFVTQAPSEITEVTTKDWDDAIVHHSQDNKIEIEFAKDMPGPVGKMVVVTFDDGTQREFALNEMNKFHESDWKNFESGIKTVGTTVNVGISPVDEKIAELREKSDLTIEDIFDAAMLYKDPRNEKALTKFRELAVEKGFEQKAIAGFFDGEAAAIEEIQKPEPVEPAEPVAPVVDPAQGDYDAMIKKLDGIDTCTKELVEQIRAFENAHPGVKKSNRVVAYEKFFKGESVWNIRKNFSSAQVDLFRTVYNEDWMKQRGAKKYNVYDFAKAQAKYNELKD